MLKKILRFLLKFVLWLFVALLVVFLIKYAWAPVYNFPEPLPFSGSKIYNPYRGMDSTAWKKGNFQIQSKVWWGITDGRNNSNKAIYEVYKQLGYDIITISDYMRINRFGVESSNYIPVYEHGYGFWKTHQVCIGSSKVNWIDYPLFQSLNHKQHIINTLHKNNKLVALAHPDLRDGYLVEDLRYLTNYDLIEVLNQCRNSPMQWDAALSHGHAAFIIANDDAHDLSNPEEVGMVCTFINTTSLKADDVINALKKGNAFGVDIFMEEGSDMAKKANDHKTLPKLTSVEVKHDTLFVSVSEPYHDVIFLGQNGARLKMMTQGKTAFYKIMPTDTYVRTEVTFWGSTRYYLNPVFRYSGNDPFKKQIPLIDMTKTWMQRSIIIFFIILVGFLLWGGKRGKNKGRLISKHPYYYTL